jgi:3-methyladenine DNA glycosylase AlkD
MPLKTKPVPARKSASDAAADERACEIVAELRRRGSKSTRDGMARYAIPSDRAFGVTVGTLKQMSKRIGRDHRLALALWETGWYEARMLAAFIDDPAQVSVSQMERWCRDFDSWAICDTVCFHLFDRTPEAWEMVGRWAQRRDEFGKRAAFALLWSLAAHDKEAAESKFLEGLGYIERAADDERNFVKKGVNMALRGVGRRGTKLHAEATKVATRLAASASAAARWVGSDALRELSRRKPS